MESRFCHEKCAIHILFSVFWWSGPFGLLDAIGPGIERMESRANEPSHAAANVRLPILEGFGYGVQPNSTLRANNGYLAN
jgi:hypothetical protein